MATKYKVIVGDVHGAWGDFIELLKKIGAVNADGTKNPDYHIIQLGDFPTLGYGVQEAAGHQEALDLVDEALLGNHCAAGLRITSHDGFEQADMGAVHQVQSNFYHGRYKVATSVGDWLVTHAGLSPYLYFKLRYDGVPADVIADDLNGRFEQYMNTSKRGELLGGSPHYEIFTHNNGILWLRYEELLKHDHQKNLKQIRGHCHYVEATLDGSGNIWNLASVKGIPALVTEDEGKTFTLVEQINLGWVPEDEQVIITHSVNPQMALAEKEMTPEWVTRRLTQ